MRRYRKVKEKKIKYYQGKDWSSRTSERKLPKRVWLLLLFPIAMGIIKLCQHNIWIAEHIFAQGIYKYYSIAYSWLTSLVPFSIAEWFYILGPIVALFFLIRYIVRMVKGTGKRFFLTWRLLLNVACFGCVAFFLYTIGTGVNYYRYSFAHFSGLNVHDSSNEELYELVEDLASRASTIRKQLKSTDESGIYQLTTNNRGTALKARAAMEELGEEYPVLNGWKATPKPVLLSKYMSYTEITGVFFAFTMECNVNVDISDYSIISTMCHELSHLRGFMREDEANYLAYLSCANSKDLETQYSGTMLALIHSGNALYKADKDLYRKAYQCYSEDVKKDLDANSEYWKKYEDTVVSTISNAMNDTYLKANHQTDGVQSYGRMVDLLLALQRKNKGVE